MGVGRLPDLPDLRLHPRRVVDDDRRPYLQIVFTASCAAISQYAIYGFIFYTWPWAC
jgi:hypothetical protein